MTPLPVRVLDRAGRALARVGARAGQLDPDAIVRAGERRARSTVRGDDGYREPLELLCDEANPSETLTLFGRIEVRTARVHRLSNRYAVAKTARSGGQARRRGRRPSAFVEWVVRLTPTLALLAVACSRPAPPPDEAPPTERQAVTVGDYDVHEWGLLRGAVREDALEVGAIAPPRAPMPLTVDKPVLYFHARSATRLERVGVEAVGGTIREHWPSTEPGFPTRITWTGLTLDPARTVAPGTCASRPFPRADQAPCDTLPEGERCESPELETVRANGATCVGEAPFLFYRSRTTTFTPPLGLTRRSDGSIEVVHRGEAPIPGYVVRIEHANGRTRTLAVRAPAPGATTVIGQDFDATDLPPVPSDEDTVDDMPVAGPDQVEAGRRAVRGTMHELGLTSEETDAFLAAWDATLFGDGVQDRRGVDTLTADETQLDGVFAPVQSILYFLPTPTCSEVARLSFDPPPRAIHRALAIWIRVD